jgi:predicted HAD superfamily Cof-like phosphohydrolase
MQTPLAIVREFHERFGVPVLNSPQLPDLDRALLRYQLITEEYEEFRDASATRNLIEIADSLADMVYVIYGTALEYGIDLDRVLDEVHRSNMSKVWEDGTVHYRVDGKVLKPPTYSRADIAGVLGV